MIRLRLARAGGGGAVLCFHSLTTTALPSAGIVNLPVELFSRLVQAARRVSRLVSLEELVTAHGSGRPTSGLTAITFDDAYASLLEAEQLLRAEAIPITVFVTSAASRAGATFWWDRVDDLCPRVGPDRWRAFEAAIGVPEEYRVGQPAMFGPVRPLRQWILANHRGRWPAELEPMLAGLEQEAGFRTPHRAMTFAELERLGRIPSVEFGVHTVSHPVLPLLSDSEFMAEVQGCYRELADLPRVRPILAIPFGLFDARTGELAGEAGMTGSLTLANRTWTGYGSADPLPRFGLTSREKPWKLMLRVTGWVERILGTRAEGTGYPDLPSATT